jgi:hypothetical protein
MGEGTSILGTGPLNRDRGICIFFIGLLRTLQNLSLSCP